MQLASSDRARGITGRLDLPHGWLIASALGLLLVQVISGSTVAAQWVPHSERLAWIALLGAAWAGALALVRRLPWPAAVVLAAAAGAAAGYRLGTAAGPALARGEPLTHQVAAFAGLIRAGDFGDPRVSTFLIALLLWVVGAWLLWSILRWRQPLPGAIPAAATLATNVLNYPAGQASYVFFFIVLLPALLLWTSYTRSLESARRLGVAATPDARWDFWESGVVVTAGIVVAGLLLPPLSLTDRTVEFEAGAFSSWANLVQALDRPVAFGPGTGFQESVGFSPSVKLGGPLTRTQALVFTYRVRGAYPLPRYFRGVTIGTPVDGRWSAGPPGHAFGLDAGYPIVYAEVPPGTEQASVSVEMLRPPALAPNLAFYPGQLVTTTRRATAFGTEDPGATVDLDSMDTVDQVRFAGSSRGGYSATVSYVYPSADELRQDTGPDPSWVLPYESPGVATPGSGWPSLQRQITQLALAWTAGMNDRYSKALAIEANLRTFKYTLKPPVPPRGTDPLDYFLFQSRAGYCEYFATAMGDLLRSIGIPSRLVNGFGPGKWDQNLKRYVVREADAHTWVEVYFPGYGWIPFEPTPQAGFPSIALRFTGSQVIGENHSTAPSHVVGAGTHQAAGGLRKGPGLVGGAGLGSGVAPRIPLAAAVVLIALGLLAGARYLRPRTAGAAWRRSIKLARLAGLSGKEGDTPAELARHAGTLFPELGADFGLLADNFTVAAYAPPGIAERAGAGVIEAWERLRPALLRRMALRLVPAWR